MAAMAAMACKLVIVRSRYDRQGRRIERLQVRRESSCAKSSGGVFELGGGGRQSLGIYECKKLEEGEVSQDVKREAECLSVEFSNLEGRLDGGSSSQQVRWVR